MTDTTTKPSVPDQKLCTVTPAKELRLLLAEARAALPPDFFGLAGRIDDVLNEPRRILEAEFYARINKTSGCWLWTGCLQTGGQYGMLYVQAQRLYAHRVSYELHIGVIPQGLQIDHLCRNHLCVNPAHLEAVTSQENTLRGNAPCAIEARAEMCKRGHARTPENVYLRLDGSGSMCRPCQQLREAGRAKRRSGGCDRCGGLIHTVDECSLNDSTCQLCGKPSPDGEHQACVDYEAAS